MLELEVKNTEGKVLEKIEVSEGLFGQKNNDALVHEALVAYLANQRRATASTKNRGQVRGGGKKPWKQKGTGRARVGSIRSPLWRGGGVTFGPTPARNYHLKINQKARRQAIRVVLSDKYRDKKILVLDNLSVGSGKTKDFAQIFQKLIGVKNKALFVNAEKDITLNRAIGNFKLADLCDFQAINIFRLLKNNYLVVTKNALLKMEERYKNG